MNHIRTLFSANESVVVRGDMKYMARGGRYYAYHNGKRKEITAAEYTKVVFSAPGTASAPKPDSTVKKENPLRQDVPDVKLRDPYATGAYMYSRSLSHDGMNKILSGGKVNKRRSDEYNNDVDIWLSSNGMGETISELTFESDKLPRGVIHDVFENVTDEETQVVVEPTPSGSLSLSLQKWVGPKKFENMCDPITVHPSLEGVIGGLEELRKSAGLSNPPNSMDFFDSWGEGKETYTTTTGAVRKTPKEMPTRTPEEFAEMHDEEFDELLSGYGAREEDWPSLANELGKRLGVEGLRMEFWADDRAPTGRVKNPFGEVEGQLYTVDIGPAGDQHKLKLSFRNYNGVYGYYDLPTAIITVEPTAQGLKDGFSQMKEKYEKGETKPVEKESKPVKKTELVGGQPSVSPAPMLKKDRELNSAEQDILEDILKTSPKEDKDSLVEGIKIIEDELGEGTFEGVARRWEPNPPGDEPVREWRSTQAWPKLANVGRAKMYFPGVSLETEFMPEVGKTIFWASTKSKDAEVFVSPVSQTEYALSVELRGEYGKRDDVITVNIDELSSDEGRQFVQEELNKWAKRKGVEAPDLFNESDDTIWL